MGYLTKAQAEYDRDQIVDGMAHLAIGPNYCGGCRQYGGGKGREKKCVKRKDLDKFQLCCKFFESRSA
jgi:hypothetical protein